MRSLATWTTRWFSTHLLDRYNHFYIAQATPNYPPFAVPLFPELAYDSWVTMVLKTTRKYL